MRRAGWLLPIVSVAAAAALGAAESGAPLTRVGPNVLVSREGDVPHVETIVAANPRDAKNLVGASIAFTKGDGGGRNEVYATKDGGATWVASAFPEESGPGFGGDPQIAFGPTGTAYFVGLSIGANSTSMPLCARSST